MPVLSENQHVCAFDRLGQDWSDPAPHPRTFATAADELHEALVALGIKKPVLIGHSLGGALVQIYAARYPVAGVALLEGLTTDNVDSVVARLGSYGQLELLARTGLLRLFAGAFVDPANQQAAAVQAEMYALRSRSSALVSVADEGVVAQQSAGVELREAEAGLHVPLLLVGAGRSEVPGLPVGAFAEALQALARRKPDARYVLIPDGSHFVFTDHPAVVAATVQDWLRSGLVHR
jgi:pimeloyl-ACP methyl ester carboxylesterase